MFTRRKLLLALVAIIGISAILFSLLADSKTGRSPSTSGSREAGTSQNSKKDDGSTKKTLKVALSLPASEFTALQSETQNYMKSHDGIEIALDNVDRSEIYAKLKKASQLGDAPDIMLLDSAWVNEFAALGFLRPMDEFYTSDQLTQRLSSVMTQVKWNGYVWGIPKSVDPYVLVWNKKTAAAGGWDHAPATKDELVSWNKTFMKPSDGKYGVYLDPTDPTALISMTTALMSSLPDNFHPMQRVNDPAFVKTLQSFLLPQETVWNGKTYSTNYPLPSSAFNPWDQLEKGNMSAMITTISEFRLHRNQDLTLAALPISFGTKTSGAWLKGTSFTISSRSGNSAAAIEWIREMTSSEAETQNWKEAGMLPVLLSSYASAPLRGDEQYNSYSWLVREGKVLPFEIDAAKKLDQLVKESGRLQKGEIDLATFTQSAAKLWNP